MTDIHFFTDNDLNKLESKIKFYFRNHPDKWIIGVDLSSAFDPRDNQMQYDAAVVYGTEDDM